MFEDYESAKVLLAAGANPWLVGNKGKLPAFMLTQPTKDAANEPARQQLLEMVKQQSATWPPPSPEDVREGFLRSGWPTAAMQESGFVASEEALKSMQLVDAAQR